MGAISIDPTAVSICLGLGKYKGEYGEYGQPYGEYGPYGPYGEYGPKNMYEPYNNDYGKGDVKGYLYSGSNTGAGNKKDEPKEANSEWKEMNLSRVNRC